VKGQSLRVLSFRVRGVNVEIRELSLSEVDEALLLIREVLLETESGECTQMGVLTFLESLRVEDFITLIREEAYLLLGAFADGDVLVGVLGARENFLVLLFVDQRFSGLGYGKSLLAHYVKRIKGGERIYREILTNASLGAVKFYEIMRFGVCGDEMVVSGVPHKPMSLRFL